MFSNSNRNGLQLVFVGALLLFSCLFSSCDEHTQQEITPITKQEVVVATPEVTPMPVKNVTIKIDSKPVDKFNSTYDIYFKKYTKRYFGPIKDYRWFKSQSMAESNLNPEAVSPVGAKGIMQIMDPTYKEIKQRNKEVIGTVFEARWNIEAGIYYDFTLYKQWASPRTEEDRFALMFASYNAGLGNILKAQKLCTSGDCGKYNCCNLWLYIKERGHEVSSWKEKETIGYVDRIFKFMDKSY